MVGPTKPLSEPEASVVLAAKSVPSPVAACKSLHFSEQPGYFTGLGRRVGVVTVSALTFYVIVFLLGSDNG